MGPQKQQQGQQYRQHEGDLDAPVDIHFQQEPGITEDAAQKGGPDQGQDDGLAQVQGGTAHQLDQIARVAALPPDAHHPVQGEHREGHGRPQCNALPGQQPERTGKHRS